MRKLFIGTCLIFSMLLTGCFGGMEVNDRAFVQLMGLERRDSIYEVTLQIYKSESGTADPDVSKANSFTVSGKGATVQSALADAEITVGKQLFLGHIKLLIIGSGIKSPADELSLFLDGSVSPSCPIAYSEDPAAAAGVLFEDGSFSAEQLLRLMDTNAAEGKTIYTSLADVASDTGVLDCACALPDIRSQGDTVIFDGLTFIRKDGAAGSLAKEDVPGVKLLQNKFKSGDKITVPIIVGDKQATVSVTGAKTGLKTKIEDGKLHVYADVKTRINITENPYEIDRSLIEHSLCEALRDTCISAFSTAVWYNSGDIFGIKIHVRRDCPGQYTEYCSNEEKYLKESIITVKISVKD
ncbi:MAG: hypothetical protein J1E40_03610 [Oscillospiraceae bacterium]|nr:hypothetical protein [Oscillospiraceae bacterium]